MVDKAFFLTSNWRSLNHKTKANTNLWKQNFVMVEKGKGKDRQCQKTNDRAGEKYETHMADTRLTAIIDKNSGK